MSLKKFENGDIFRNILETYPRFEFRLQGNRVYENNDINGSFTSGIGPPEQPVYEDKLDFTVKSNTQYVPII